MIHPGERLRFQLERWIQRGVFYQLLFVAALIVAISVLGVPSAWKATDQFSSPFDGIWWSFRRLTDPGYLGDDEGAVLRVVSTIVTVLGYVLFMGSLIAIMTQWLNQTLRRFESGLAPISMRGHVVILGWTNRTPEIIRQLLSARGRLRRFLAAHNQRILRIVIVADEVSAERRHRLRTFLGDQWRGRQIFLRAGSSLRSEDLTRFDLQEAAAIIVPGDEFRYGGTEASDTRVVKTLLNLRPILESVPEATRPSIVAEMFDPRKERAARRALKVRLEVVPGEPVIARLLAQTVRDRRLAAVFFELLSHRRGCAPYVREFPELTGHHPVDLDGRFNKAVVIGALRTEQGRAVTYLNPPRDFRLERDDMLVLIARAYEDCAITRAAEKETPVESGLRADTPTPFSRRVLVVGWSHKIGSILQELGNTDAATVEVTIVSRVSQAKREGRLQGYGWDPAQVRVNHVEADYLVSGVLEALGLQHFECILLPASTSMESAEEADARIVLGYELLRSVLEDQVPDGKKGPEIIVEIVHPASSQHFSDPQDVVLVSPNILGYLQTHVALRPELNSVFGEMFAPGGAEVAVRRADEYGLESSTVHYRDIELQAVSHEEIALGLLTASGTSGVQLELCPPPDRRWSADAEGDIIVLAAGRENRTRETGAC